MKDGLWLILAFVGGWFFAQFSKVLKVMWQQKGRISAQELSVILFKSGGMPSGHTAGCIAGCVLLGLSYGWDSIYFALCACFTALIIYDAVNMRYAVGEQGRVMNEMIKKDKDLSKVKPVKLVEGHTVPEVIGGIILGIIVGWAVYNWMILM